MLYLDYQASAPLAASVFDAMLPFFTGVHGNPHSDDHAAGWEASRAIEQARAKVADAIGCDAEEVVFTSGATEANNIAILGAAAGRSGGSRRVLISAIEHKAVLAPARALAKRGFDLVVLPVLQDGSIDLNVLKSELDRGACLVSIGAANNEIGTVQDLETIGCMVREAGVLFHSDATQTLAWRGFDADTAVVDLASFSAHKIGGPKGVGALLIRHAARNRIASVMFGGEQEGGIRPGTLPTPLCVGFGAACESLPDGKVIEQWRAMTDFLASALEDLIPGMRRNGQRHGGHPGNLSATLPGIEADMLIARLQPKLALSRGSACTSGITEPSHVLRAIGLDVDDANATVRLSTGPATTMQDVELAAELIAKALDI